MIRPLKRAHNAFNSYILLAGLYVVLNLLLPANHTTQAIYHLSATQYRILILVIILPIVLIWFMAFYGYAKIKEYVAFIATAPEGEAFANVASGLKWLAWWLPLPSFVSLVTNTIVNAHPGFYHASIIINNYVSLVIALGAFHILSTGSRQLLEREKLYISNRVAKLMVLFFVILGAIYCFLVFHNLGGHPATSTDNPYFLPVWLLVATIVVPYLYAWFVGLLAAYEVNLISHHSTGLLYKKALAQLARGLALIVGSSIAIQYLTSVVPRSGHLALGYVLVIIYLALILIAAGFGLLAIGTNKLKRIEEV